MEPRDGFGHLELPRLLGGRDIMYAKNFPCHRRDLRGNRVLVVEDEALVAMLIEDGLLDAGAQVIGPAGSVQEALQLIEQAASDGGLDAAVLDINLGGDTVSPVADRLAALQVPFVFATGYGKYCGRGVHSDAQVMTKPYDPDALVAVIKNLAPAGR
ncbi:response regulator [Siccirubricoccus deserti]|nr:response regulator [Siccirubricoccus deserti]